MGQVVDSSATLTEIAVTCCPASSNVVCNVRSSHLHFSHRKSDRLRFAAESTFYQAVEQSFWTKVEGFIERAADPGKEPSPERKQKLEQNIRTLADRWRPIVTEALSVFMPEKSAKSDAPTEKSATTENDAKPAQ